MAADGHKDNNVNKVKFTIRHLVEQEVEKPQLAPYLWQGPCPSFICTDDELSADSLPDAEDAEDTEEPVYYSLAAMVPDTPKLPPVFDEHHSAARAKRVRPENKIDSPLSPESARQLGALAGYGGLAGSYSGKPR